MLKYLQGERQISFTDSNNKQIQTKLKNMNNNLAIKMICAIFCLKSNVKLILLAFC